MTFKVKSGINVGNINVIDSNSKYQQTDLSPVNKPTLILDFINTQAIDTRLTFVRSSNGTFVSQRGLVETATAGVPRFDYANNVCQGILIEDQRTNYVTFSGDFTYSDWGKNSGAIINRMATTAPDGSMSADIIIATGAGSSGVYRFVTGLANNTIYTMSVYVKNISSATTIRIGTDANPSTGTVDFSFVSGTITGAGGSVTWSRVDNIGNGWYRVACSFTSTAANPSFVIYNATATPCQFAVWGPQVEVNYGATSYIPSTETFTSRSSNATYIDSTDGLIRYAGVNLLTNSESTLGALGAVTLAYNALVSPIGTTTGTLVTITALTGHAASKSVIVSSSTQYTFSFYAQRGSATQMAYSVYDNTNAVDIVSTTNYYGSTSATGWARIAVTFTTPSTCTSVNVYPARDGGSIGTFGVWGLQLEVGSSATLYSVTTASTSAAVRPLYNPGTRINRGRLLEPAATNLFTYSDDMSNAVWLKFAGTLSSNTGNAPDGNLTADKWVEDATSNEHLIYQAVNANNITQTFSVFVKPAERTKIYLGFSNFVNTATIVMFDLANNNIIATTANNADYTNTRGQITYVANGWFRCAITSTKGTLNNVNNPNITLVNAANNSLYLGDGTSGVFLWGAQLETGPYATSYIPTVASTVTKAADIYTSATTTRQYDSLSTTNLNWFDPTQGTFVVDFDSISTTNSPFILASGPEYATGRGGFNTVGTWDGTNEINAVNTLANTAVYASFGVSWSSAGKLVSLNGSIPVVNASSTFSPTMPGTFTFGSTTGGGRSILGHMKRVVYYNQRVSNNELQALTKI